MSRLLSACRLKGSMGKLGGGFTDILPKEKRAIGDFYPTPDCAINVLLEKEVFEGEIWECASGHGAISKLLEARGHNVYSSDIRTEAEVHGEGGVNFLASQRKSENILTNPPFCLAEEFIYKALELTTKKSAFLLRLAFLESERRNKLFTQFPPSKVIVISRRLPFFHDNKWHMKGSTFPHAWIIWDKQHQGPTQLEWGTF